MLVKARMEEGGTRSSGHGSGPTLADRHREAAQDDRRSVERLAAIGDVLDKVITLAAIAGESKNSKVSGPAKVLAFGLTPIKTQVEKAKDEMEKSADDHERKADELDRSRSPVHPGTSSDPLGSRGRDHGGSREVDARDSLDRTDARTMEA